MVVEINGYAERGLVCGLFCHESLVAAPGPHQNNANNFNIKCQFKGVGTSPSKSFKSAKQFFVDS